MVDLKKIKEGNMISDVFLCNEKNTKVTNDGKTFFFVRLSNKTGSIGANIWDIEKNILSGFEKGDFVKVEGCIKSFNKKNEIGIRTIGKYDGEIDKKDFYKMTKYGREALWAEIKIMLSNIEDPNLRKLLSNIFSDAGFRKSYLNNASSTMHHYSFLGGLMQHSVTVAKACIKMSEIYPEANKDLLVTAALLHECGKIETIITFPETSYSRCGRLMDYVTKSVLIVSENISKIPDFPHELKDELLHCILTNYENAEMEGIQKAATIEAEILKSVSALDIRIETYFEEGEIETEDEFIYSRNLSKNIKPINPVCGKG